MKRTQIQLDDETYEILRRRAHHERRSMSALVRDALKRTQPARSTRRRLEDFRFVGIGRSPKRPGLPVSEDHDAALAAAAAVRRRARRG